MQKEYSTRQGDLVNGIILGMERRNFLVDLGKTEAILPIQEQIPRETYRRGDRVKAMLLEVRRTPKDVQVILIAKPSTIRREDVRTGGAGGRREDRRDQVDRARAGRSNEDRGLVA